MNKLEAMRTQRRQTDLLSIKELAEFLRKVITKPENYLNDDRLKTALNSQGALAKYTGSSSTFIAMSLNHQRLMAEIVFGSYDVLDALRRSGKDAISFEHARIKRGHVKTKEGLLARVQELESDQALLKRDLALLQRAYDLRCLQARTYATAAGSTIQALCAKEQKEIDASFSLRHKPIESTKIVGIEELRKHATKTTK